MSLSNEEISRYSRQMILPEIGRDGQQALKTSKILIVGCGGLGCPSSQYLAAAGVGTIGLVDYDVVEVSNLHRQICHSKETVGVSKTESLKRYINGLNEHVDVIKHDVVLDSSNARTIIKGYDIVLDASDNIATRYLVKTAVFLKTNH